MLDVGLVVGLGVGLVMLVGDDVGVGLMLGDVVASRVVGLGLVVAFRLHSRPPDTATTTSRSKKRRRAITPTIVCDCAPVC